jgi:hydroxymethylbilane synthase
LREFGGKGMFTKEIDEALLDARVDMAVHSMKDLPTELPGELCVAAVLPRGDVRDAFISNKGESLGALPPGAAVGTSSLRAPSTGPALAAGFPRGRLPRQCRDPAQEARSRLG